jgi:hypothetical protein
MSFCLFWCGSDSFCAAGCLRKNAYLSPWMYNTISCITVIGQAGSPSEADLEACLQEPTEDYNELQAEIVRGVASLASCSVHSCEDARIEFAEGLGRINRCTDACISSPQDYVEGVTTNLESLQTTPIGMICAFHCTLSDSQL